VNWKGNRAVWVPVFWYLAETLGAPAVNGAAAHLEFWRHAATVLGVVLVLVAVHLLVRRLARRAPAPSRVLTVGLLATCSSSRPAPS
jgi:hypothetical protein